MMLPTTARFATWGEDLHGPAQRTAPVVVDKSRRIFSNSGWAAQTAAEMLVDDSIASDSPLANLCREFLRRHAH